MLNKLEKTGQTTPDAELKPLEHPDRNQDKVLIFFLLDRTGSMDEKKGVTIEAYNAYLSSLQRDLAGVDVKFNMSQFDSHRGRKVFDTNVPLERATRLTTTNYDCQGGTDLIDNCMAVIADAKREAEHIGGRPKVIVVFQTDGEHNVSGRYTAANLKAEVTLMRERGWQFVFLGCDINAYTMGDMFNIPRDSVLSYKGAMSGSAMRNLASNTARYASGATASLSFTQDQKRDAGDNS